MNFVKTKKIHKTIKLKKLLVEIIDLRKIFSYLWKSFYAPPTEAKCQYIVRFKNAVVAFVFVTAFCFFQLLQNLQLFWVKLLNLPYILFSHILFPRILFWGILFIKDFPDRKFVWKMISYFILLQEAAIVKSTPTKTTTLCNLSKIWNIYKPKTKSL